MNFSKMPIIIILIFIAFTAFLSVIFSIVNMNNESIFSGVSVNGISLSGMTKDEANKKLSSLIDQKTNSSLTLISNDFEYNLPYADLNVHYNITDAVNDAYNYGKSGSIFQNNFAILGALIFRKNFSIDVSFDDDSFSSVVSDISSSLPNKLVNPSYYIEDKNLIITRGNSGMIIEEDTFKSSLLYNLSNISSTENSVVLPLKEQKPDSIDVDSIHSEIKKEVKDAYYEKSPFKVYAEVIGVDFDLDKVKTLMEQDPDAEEYTAELKYTYPKVTIEKLNIDVFPDLLATFSTRYDATNTARSTNLQLAAKKIDNTILSPGEEFSYNKIVGERSISAGYKEAKIYSNGQVVDGIGGGICQISSTLYNAVIFANLKVTERHNHQFVTSYLAPGRDATVVYGAKDFKFKNTRTYPIKIKFSINSGIAKVDIYGIKEDVEYDVSFDVETISDIKYSIKYERDYSLQQGEEIIKQAGSQGAVVKVYKVLKKGGVQVSKEFLSKDSYKALERIVVNRTGKGD